MRIYLADDHQVVRDGLKMIIQSEFQEASFFEANNFTELKELVQEDSSQDLILCDFKMPEMDSYAGIQLIRDSFPNIKLIILSGSFEQDDIGSTLKLGVNGFVAKTSAGTSLINIIRLVLAGETYIPSESLNTFVSSKNSDSHEKVAISLLTAREKQVLQQLGKGHSNKQIARDLNIEESTIKSHIKNIYEKLSVANRTQAASFSVYL